MAGPCSSGATAMKFSASDARVGIVSWDYGEYARGGLGRAMAGMMEALREQGVSVEVFARSYWLLVTRYSFIVFVWCFLRRWIDTHRVRTVILPTGPGGLFLWRKPKRCRLIIVSYHTYWQQARYVPWQWWKRVLVPLERRTFALADQVFCYSPDTEHILLQQYGVPRANLKLLPQLLDVAAWSSSLAPKEGGLCVFVARLDCRKGIDVLLQAWPSVVGAWPTAHLVIVGDGRGRKRVRDVVAHHSSVQWVPSLPREELVHLLQRAEIAVCPSYLEGFGLACAEAMVAGTAVIASDCDGLRSLIRHGETGLLVPPSDPVALADGMTELLRDAVLRRRLVERAQGETVRIFDWQEAVCRLLTVLEEPPSSEEGGL